MAKIKFKQFSRYDEARAKQGVPYAVTDELGQYRGTFTVSLFDMNSKFVRVEMDRFYRENKAELDKTKDDSLRGVMLFVNCFLHGWEDVPGENDKPVPFDRDTALELLGSDEWLTDRLVEYSKDVRNFQADPRATKDEEAKN